MTIIRMKDTRAEKERRGSVARENNVEREGGKEGKGGGDEKVEQGEKERTIIFFSTGISAWKRTKTLITIA